MMNESEPGGRANDPGLVAHLEREASVAKIMTCEACGQVFTRRTGPAVHCSLSCRFWSKVDRGAGPRACWPWTALRSRSGYGHTYVRSSPARAHRVAWELTRGPIPEGLIVRHLVCDNPLCCNPAHLAVGTNADNSADMTAKGRQALGVRNGNVRLTEADVRALRATSETVSCAEWGRRLGVSKRVIYDVRSGRIWKHVKGAA